MIQLIRYKYVAKTLNRRIELQEIKSKTNKHLDRMLILLALNKIAQRQRVSHIIMLNKKDRQKELEQIGFLTVLKDDKSLLRNMGI
jgi:hypothetical protein